MRKEKRGGAERRTIEKSRPREEVSKGSFQREGDVMGQESGATDLFGWRGVGIFARTECRCIHDYAFLHIYVHAKRNKFPARSLTLLAEENFPR